MYRYRVSYQALAGCGQIVVDTRSIREYLSSF